MRPRGACKFKCVCIIRSSASVFTRSRNRASYSVGSYPGVVVFGLVGRHVVFDDDEASRVPNAWAAGLAVTLCASRASTFYSFCSALAAAAAA